MKVKMYRGIDQNDGEMSLFAVIDGKIAPTLYHQHSNWLEEETFISILATFGVSFGKEGLYEESLAKAELIWEN